MVQPSSPSPTPVPLPKVIGRYDVVRLIGEGAMGRVLLAHDTVLTREVALKLLRDDLQIPEEVRQGLLVRMRNEARAAARVTHPNIVTLHDLGEHEEVGLYLVFEYVEGPSLKQRLKEGRLTPAQVARLARELGSALSCAHRAGVVHRDVKPENIILSSSGGKIADFGIARIPDSTLTHAGGLLGTPAYSAPETFHDGRFSPESDQFSLAASLYEALSGKRAFPGEDAVAVASSIATQIPRRVATDLGISSVVDDVLLRALAKEPAQRFPSCDEFGMALAKSLIATFGIAPPPQPRAAPAVPTDIPDELPRPERKVTQIAIGGLVVVVTALLLVRTALRSSEADDGDGPAPGLSASASASSRAPLGAGTIAPATTHRPRAKPDPVAPQRPDADAGAASAAPTGTARSGAADATGTATAAPGPGAQPPARGADSNSPP